MTSLTLTPTQQAVRQAGFSLVELLVAMAMMVGLMTIVLSAYQGMFSGNRLGEAQQQVNEDAQTAFQLLGPQIRAAGYNPPQRVLPIQPLQNALSKPLPLLAGEVDMGLYGCANGFSNGSGAAAAGQISALLCNATVVGSNSPSFAVLYEADSLSPHKAGNSPADCRGFAVPPQNQNLVTPVPPNLPAASYQIVENRYFISNGGLSCTGNGSVTPFDAPTQPLVSNIESMQIGYGVIGPAQLPLNNTTFISGYLTADQIGGATGLPGASVDPSLAGLFQLQPPPLPTQQLNGSLRWSLVKTVRVCLVVKSETKVLTDTLGTTPNGDNIFGYYAGCNPTDATQIPITDRFLRKSFVMHFAVRPRV
jgi:prepilin-type N-terminal cleavage/methylation domain-containing protein